MMPSSFTTVLGNMVGKGNEAIMSVEAVARVLVW